MVEQAQKQGDCLPPTPLPVFRSVKTDLYQWIPLCFISATSDIQRRYLITGMLLFVAVILEFHWKAQIPCLTLILWTLLHVLGV